MRYVMRRDLLMAMDRKHNVRRIVAWSTSIYPILSIRHYEGSNAISVINDHHQ